MVRSARFAAVVAALAAAACSSDGSSNVPTAAGALQIGAPAFMNPQPQWLAKHIARALCPQVIGRPTCLALISNAVSPACAPAGGSCGWTPSQLQTRYGLRGLLSKGKGTIVAVVEAGDNPDAAADLATYRKQFSLGTTSFHKYNQQGKEQNYPPSCKDYGWCPETDLDIEMVSASCPKCSIALMEGDDSTSGFEQAEASAVRLGAKIVSNSWICYVSMNCGDVYFPNYFDTKGITYVASSGDFGLNNIGAPSALPTVVAVGGTQLEKYGTDYKEYVWPDAGGGCANPFNVGGAGIARPKWQHNPDCRHRSDADASAEAGCEPGVAEYTSIYGPPQWADICGTSVAAPLAAGMFALAGNATTQEGGRTFWETQHQKYLHNVCRLDCLYDTYTYQAGWGSAAGIQAF
jgi:subtilase family serine protease